MIKTKTKTHWNGDITTKVVLPAKDVNIMELASIMITLEDIVFMQPNMSKTAFENLKDNLRDEIRKGRGV